MVGLTWLCEHGICLVQLDAGLHTTVECGLNITHSIVMEVRVCLRLFIPQEKQTVAKESWQSLSSAQHRCDMRA